MTYQGVIEVTELAELVDQRDRNAGQLVILDCRYNLADKQAGEQAYLSEHIPGAHYASLHQDLSGACERYGGRHPLPSAHPFSEFARSVGVSEETQVVVYDDQRFAFAARAWWLFRHFGHAQVAVLNGGLQAWKKAGLPTTADRTSAPAAGSFTASANAAELVHYDDLYPHLQTPPWQLVDAREPKRFLGNEEPIDPVAGHIPGAVNKPWQDITDDQGMIKPIATLREHWQTIPADDDIVCYCGSGVTACVNLLSLHLIGRKAQLYPGSWSDWCAHILHPRTEPA
ncbi:sulfurtransferase [Microbulbifer salipaludis]|uniref:Sulfurtransferase n=1 Tax=Microbulbifer salipaludis TaxID=187980 RepID=A0ABS3E872_9GAMM|nr:sulfurtransferase [Microbulbifer salipaludis]MBN8431398.1 sulfurtransferase [Microbulbifer salipaludis]